MNEFYNKHNFIRTRINGNLIDVKEECPDVKSLLSLGVQTSKPNNDKNVPNSGYNDILHDLNLTATYTSRKDLLRVCILLATSRNTVAQENLMDVISIKLGRIKDKDYQYVANLIYLKDSQDVDKVNQYLSIHLDDFDEMHKKYYKKYYGF